MVGGRYVKEVREGTGHAGGRDLLLVAGRGTGEKYLVSEKKEEYDT